MRPSFADPNRLARQAKADAASVEGSLREWSTAPQETRTHRQRPVALALYDFYFAMARKLAELDGRATNLSHEEIQSYHQLEEVLAEDKGAGSSFLAQVHGSAKRRYRTGDAKLDQWYNQLDQGEIPDEFWGPKGKPSKAKAMSWEKMMAEAAKR